MVKWYMVDGACACAHTHYIHNTVPGIGINIYCTKITHLWHSSDGLPT